MNNRLLIKSSLLTCAITLAVSPLFNPGTAFAATPERCLGFGDVQSIDLTDWEGGLGSWVADTYSVGNPATFDTPDWTATTALPDARPGSAAFVENVNLGDCAADDESGVLTLTSPVIQIPLGVEVPRLSLDHWFQTEVDWDGGNIKISVNGGTFELVPSTAFEHSPYTGTLNPPFDEFGLLFNLNPLADQAAFTGTPDGAAQGSWIQSQISLLNIADAGDTVQIRLDFGVDDCNGEVGWYVDDLEIYACTAEVEPVCGNNVLESGEQCDDGNLLDGDGCSQSCEVEENWTCQDPLEPGGGSTCTENSSLTLIKQIVNDNGGTSVPVNWTLTASGPTGFSGRGPDVNSPDGFEPGDYDLSESGSEAGYQQSNWSCQDGTLIDSNTVRISAGEDVVCTVVNNDIEPSLTLIKTIVNDDDGVSIPEDWTLTANGPTAFSGTGPTVSSPSGFVAGTYVLSESGGPGGYVASSWDCVGANVSGGNRVTVELGAVVSCTITNDDFDTSTEINVGHAGAWYFPETSGQGVVIDVDPVTQFMFAAWFTYTDEASDNPFEQRWFTAEGGFEGNTADLILWETLGGQFDDPQSVVYTPIGTVTIVFSGCENAHMTYQFDNEELSGDFPLIRGIPDSAVICEEQIAENPQPETESSGTEDTIQAENINSGMDGAWYDPDTAGQGFLVDARPDPESGNFMFVAWFTYGDLNASGQWWLTAEGWFEGSTADLIIYETTGGSFDDPLRPTFEAIGEMQIDFADCDNATIFYSMPDRQLEGEISITRGIPGTEVLCQAISDAE